MQGNGGGKSATTGRMMATDGRGAGAVRRDAGRQGWWTGETPSRSRWNKLRILRRIGSDTCDNVANLVAGVKWQTSQVLAKVSSQVSSQELRG